MSEEFEAALRPIEADRRSFLKKLAMGTVFVVPTVSSFTMTGIEAVYAQTPSASGSEVEGTGEEQTTTTESTTTTTESTTTTTQPNQTTSTTTTTQPNQTEIN